MHLQCDVVQCSGGCADDEVCPGDTLVASTNKGGRALGSKTEDGMLLAATTVFVLDPSEAPRKKTNISHYLFTYRRNENNHFFFLCFFFRRGVCNM